MIKYLANSDICEKLATKLTEKLSDEVNNPDLRNDFDTSSRCVLIITERKEDPVTPLLN